MGGSTANAHTLRNPTTLIPSRLNSRYESSAILSRESAEKPLLSVFTSPSMPTQAIRPPILSSNARKRAHALRPQHKTKDMVTQKLANLVLTEIEEEPAAHSIKKKRTQIKQTYDELRKTDYTLFVSNIDGIESIEKQAFKSYSVVKQSEMAIKNMLSLDFSTFLNNVAAMNELGSV